MTFEALSQAYLSQRSGHSESTRRLCEGWLARFSGFCRHHRLPAVMGLTPADLDAFHSELLWTRNARGRFYSLNSVYQALQMVRDCLRWGSAQGWLLLDPTRNLVLPRPPQPRQRVLTRAEVRQLLDRPDPSHRLGLRDRAVLALFTYLPLSPRQAAALETRNLSDGQLRCQAAEDGFPLEPELADRLDRYGRARLDLVREPAEPALFLTQSGRRLGAERLFSLVRDAGH